MFPFIFTEVFSSKSALGALTGFAYLFQKNVVKKIASVKEAYCCLFITLTKCSPAYNLLRIKNDQ